MSKENEILFLEPYFVPLIWGSESWGISAYKGASSIIKNERYSGMDLRDLWKGHRDLFGNLDMEEFPHLVKFIDAKRDLSVQVHPNDAYAQEVEGEPYGKKECWLILDCEQNTKIIIGHKCHSREEMQECISNNQWDKVLNEIPIKPGDFFQIDPGTIHAIKGGTKILETQQTSDLTYRLYDYDRLENGKPRELHIEKALDVINFKNPKIDEQNFNDAQDLETQLVSTDKYTVNLLNIKGSETFEQKFPFLNCTVISGNGEIDGNKIKESDNFIIPNNYGKFTIEGNLKILTSYISN